MSASGPPSGGSGAPPGGSGGPTPPGVSGDGFTAPVFTPEQLAVLPHDDMGPTLLAVIWTLSGLASTFLGLRLYCKLTNTRRLWWDDYFLIASWLLLVSENSITTYLIVDLSFGKHIWDFPLQNFAKFLLPVMIRGTFSITLLAWSKTAFAVTLLRLTDGRTRQVVIGIIVLVNVTLGLSALLPWVTCTPIRYAWDNSIPGTCIPQHILMSYNIFSGAISGAMDFALALIPWKLLMGLQMRKKEKIGAGIAMSMGILAGVAAIIKTANLPKLYSSDIYDGAQLFIWDTAEGAVTIVAASIPALRVLIRDVSSAIRSTQKSTTRRTTSKFNDSRFLSHLDKQAEAKNLGSSHDGGSGQLDSRSDKSILRDSVEQATPNEGTIMRTDTVMVEYNSRKKGEDIEMGRVIPRR